MRPGAWPVWLGALLYAAGVLVWLDRERPRDARSFDAGSIHNLSPRGLALAFRYLQARPGAPARVAALTSALSAASVEPDAVVLRWRPTHLPASVAGPREGGRAAVRPLPVLPLSPAEDLWVRGGGRLVLGLSHGYGAVQVAAAAGKEPEVRKVFPAWPEVRRLRPQHPQALDGAALDQGHTLFVVGSQAAIVRWPLGRGELLAVALPELIENERLARADHLALLHALCGTLRPVYFDEHAHGLGREEGLLRLLLDWRLGPVLALLALAATLAFWRASRTIGPPAGDPAETRSDAVDLVDSLAQLYERALSRREAVTLYRQALRRTLALRTGLKGRALEARAQELLGGEVLPAPRGRADIPPAELQRALRALNAAFRRLSEHAHPR